MKIKRFGKDDIMGVVALEHSYIIFDIERC
jgi:hypothetical protein